MKRPLAHRALRACGGAAVLLGVMLTAALAAAAQPADQSALQESHPLQEVQVTASKLDRHTLKRVAIQFVKLHGAVSPVIHQIGRWQADVCPRVTGLNPAAERVCLAPREGSRAERRRTDPLESAKDARSTSRSSSRPSRSNC